MGGLGIRAAREANTSLLGKLVWDMVQSSSKLWVSLLSNKYTGGHNTLLASASNNNSPIWSSIIRAKNILKEGYTWRIGSGSSSFWFSNWNSLGPIDNYVPVIDIHDLHLSVRVFYPLQVTALSFSTLISHQLLRITSTTFISNLMTIFRMF